MANFPDRLCALLYFGGVGFDVMLRLSIPPIVAEPAPIFMFAPFRSTFKIVIHLYSWPVAPKLEPVIVIDEPSIKLPEKLVILGWAKADALQKMVSRKKLQLSFD